MRFRVLKYQAKEEFELAANMFSIIHIFKNWQEHRDDLDYPKKEDNYVCILPYRLPLIFLRNLIEMSITMYAVSY